jgi:thiamine-phosphate pyrophosphorylase
VVGTIYHTPSHPDRAPAGPNLVSDVARLGLPVIAIGGITPELAGELNAAGAYGVAAIRSLWYAADPAAATLAMLAPWLEEA